MTRPSFARIDLSALRQNYLTAKRLHGGKVLAVMKANAYGHGAQRCAHALAEIADGFAVAFIDEAMELRVAGIQSPILVLEGVFDKGELATAARHDLWVVVHQQSQLEMLEQVSDLGKPVDVWLKMDSGMGRAGFAASAMKPSYARLKACRTVRNVVLMSHFARADEPGVSVTSHQIDTFDKACEGLDAPKSLANSAAMMAWPQASRDWGRAGIMLYGADPLPPTSEGSCLRPVMALESEVFAERTLEAGCPLGYGGGFVAQRRTRVGLVAMGYADGYPRTAPTGTPVLVDGHPTQLIGRVSMDMLTVDLTDIPQAGCGSKVELWGKNIDINRIAQAVGTISYELLCNVKRVERSYVGLPTSAATHHHFSTLVPT